MNDIYKKIIELKEAGIKAVLCTIVQTKGSTPRKAGSKMIVLEDMRIYGTIGGGILEKTVMERAVEIINSATPELISFDLTKDLGMVCGGSVEVFIEPIFDKYKLYIFGAGHIGKALVRHTIGLNFDIYVIDERKNIFNDWDIGGVSAENISFDSFIDKHRADDATFIVIATTGHVSDKEILKRYIKDSFAYIGVIGSRRKAEEIKNMFINESFATEEEMSRVDIPMGIEIMAEGPDEIAISIAGKLVLEKNRLLGLK